MSVDGVDNPSGTQATEQTETAENTKPTGTPPASSQSSQTKVGNLNKLKEDSPEVYKKMLEAMFQDINKLQQKHEKRMKEIRQKGGG